MMTRKWVNPKEIICIICYDSPLNVGEICDILYGKRNSRIPTLLKELTTKKWIKPVIPSNKDAFRHHYFQTIPECFLEDFLKTLEENDYKLTGDEKKRLKQFLIGDYFKRIIKYIKKPGFLPNIQGFSTLKEIISYRCATILVEGYYSFYKFNKKNYDISLESTLMKSIVENESVPIPLDNVFSIIENLYKKNDYSGNKLHPDFSTSEFKLLGLPLIHKLMYLQPWFKLTFLQGMFISIARYVEYANIVKK